MKKQVVLIVAVLLSSINMVRASTLLTFGDGSAVTTIDRSTIFDNLDFAHNGMPLDGYQSNGLSVTTNGNSYYGDNAVGQVGLGGEPVNSSSPYLNPFLMTGPSGPSYSFIGGGYYFAYDSEFGNSDWVSIQTSDTKKMYGVEFLYGNGWSNGDVYGTLPWGNSTIPLEWQTYNGANLVSSGSVTTGVGTVVGFSDPNGFDLLRVRAPGNGTNWQEIALDNLMVQTTPVPEPATLVLFAAGAIGLLGIAWRKRLRA
jgi:hypothetical protein